MNYFVVPGLKRQFIEMKRNLKKEEIINAVYRHFKISKADLYKGGRFKKFAHARFICFLLLHKYTPLNKCEIGEAFNMDHTSVIHGIKKIKRLLEVNDSLVYDVVEIEAKVKVI